MASSSFEKHLTFLNVIPNVKSKKMNLVLKEAAFDSTRSLKFMLRKLKK
jgi:hypothetical protein